MNKFNFYIHAKVTDHGALTSFSRWKLPYFYTILKPAMILYHGSDTAVERPNLDLPRKNLDFGVGFYTTESKIQAVNFAQKVMIRKAKKSRLVSVFDFDMDAAQRVLDVLRFLAPDRLWLDFVHQNRQGTYAEKLYDLVIGPVANDDVR